jgi:hypothetical protein
MLFTSDRSSSASAALLSVSAAVLYVGGLTAIYLVESRTLIPYHWSSLRPRWLPGS